MFLIKTENGLGQDDVYDVSHSLMEVPDETLFYRHMHPHCELLLFIRGDADYFIDGNCYRLHPYDLLLIPEGIYHYLTLRSAAQYENYVVNFRESLLPGGTVRRLFEGPNVFNIGADTELMGLFSRLDLCHSLYGWEDFRCAAACLVQEILLYCAYAKRTPAPASEKRSELLADTLRYIDAHLEDDLDAEILAEALTISRSHLQNVFSERMQIGLKQYIMQKKILAAHRDLLGGMAAGDAAARYRFGDYSTFYRLYRKTFGASPSDAHP